MRETAIDSKRGQIATEARTRTRERREWRCLSASASLRKNHFMVLVTLWQDKRHGKEAHPDLPAVVVDTTLKRLHRSFTRPVPSPPRAEFLDHLFQYPLFARNQARAKGQYLGATPIKPPARLACRGAAA